MRKLLAAAMAMGVMGCSGEGDIDRTQVNKVHKSMFQGTWYLGLTATDVPATSVASFVGAQSELEKVVWEIQENHLIAYRAYEEVPGSDPRVDYNPDDDLLPGQTGVADGQGEGFDQGLYRENPVAVFEIEKHFDIKRDYNEATGEQVNVILENDEDRPWFEREWMRVNWANMQLATSANSMYMPGQGEVTFFHQQAEGSEDSIRFIDDTGKCVNFDGSKGGQWAQDHCVEFKNSGTVTYFDMVGEILQTPAMQADANGNMQPACLFVANFPATCGATRMKVRLSVMRVGQVVELPIAEGEDQTHHVVTTAPREYEPRHYDNRMLGKFGFFRVDRQTYDRGYETTEAGRVYLAAIHNIWKEVWEKDEQGKIRRDENGQKVLIPVADREPRPVVYHLSPHFRPEMLPMHEDIAAGYNTAFRRAVALAKGLIPDQYDDIDEISEDVVPTMFKINYNGWVCEGGTWNMGVCEGGEVKYNEDYQVARIGDLRYNFIALVDSLQLQSPFGYGPSLPDPETGEIISSRAYVYGAVLDRQAQYALDIVKLLTGGLTEDQLVDGDYIREYVEENLDPIDPSRIQPALSHVTLDLEGLEKVMGPRFNKVLPFLEADDITELLPRVTRGWYQKRFEKLVDSEYGEHLLSDQMRAELAGPALGMTWSPSEPLPDAMRDYASPERWLGPDALEKTRSRIAFASENNIYLEEFVDDTIYGLATQLYEDYDGDEDKMRNKLAELILRGVMEHEIGHTVGLRHNFAGSFDSLNYHDTWWDLKQESFENIGSVKPPSTLDQVYELNRLTEDQKLGRMREYQHSTIMDYGATFNDDVHGLGKYDHAAIAFGYGGGIEVFDEDRMDADHLADMKRFMRQRIVYGANKCLSLFDDRRAPFFSMMTEAYHYTTIADRIGVTPSDNSALRARRWMKWSDLQPEHRAAFDECKEFLGASPDPESTLDGILYDEAGGVDVGDAGWTEPDRPLEFPYAFCGDEYAETTMSCHRWDMGADLLEIAQRGTTDYEAYYFFRTYRNNRYPFTASSYVSGLTGRTLFILPTVYQNWLGQVNWGTIDGVQLLSATMGMQLGFDTLTRILMRPAYGKYEFSPARQEFVIVDPDPDTPVDETAEFLVPRGQGRIYGTQFDFVDHGYDYQNHIREQAHYWDAQAAIQMLTGASVLLAGVDVTADQFLYLTPYEIIFGEELYRLFNGLWAGEARLFMPRVEVDEDICQSMGKPVTTVGCYVDRPLASHLHSDRNFDYIDPRDLTVWPDDPVGVPLDPRTIPFNTQAQAIQMGMALFGYGRYDDYQDSNYLWLYNGEDVTIPDPPTDGINILSAETDCAAPTELCEFTLEGVHWVEFPEGAVFRVHSANGNQGDYLVAEDATTDGTNTMVKVTTPIPSDVVAGDYVPEAYWEKMYCQDPRVWNGQTWGTLRKTDGSVDDRPAVIWMRRCKIAEQNVRNTVYPSKEYDRRAAEFGGVSWRLDWMRGLNEIFGHTL